MPVSSDSRAGCLDRWSEVRGLCPLCRCWAVAFSDFITNFEVPGRPVLLCGWMDDWPAMKKWDIDTLRRDYRAAKFKVGEKDNGDKIRMKMVRWLAHEGLRTNQFQPLSNYLFSLSYVVQKYFIDYMKHQNDDSPLYLFESAVEDKANTWCEIQSLAAIKGANRLTSIYLTRLANRTQLHPYALVRPNVPRKINRGRRFIASASLLSVHDVIAAAC